MTEEGITKRATLQKLFANNNLKRQTSNTNFDDRLNSFLSKLAKRIDKTRNKVTIADLEKFGYFDCREECGQSTALFIRRLCRNAGFPDFWAASK